MGKCAVEFPFWVLKSYDIFVSLTLTCLKNMKKYFIILFWFFCIQINAQISFTENLITSTVTNNSVTPFDVDNDGDIDIISCDKSTNEIRLHKNMGNGIFENSVIDITTEIPVYVYGFDVDQDGRIDILNSRKGYDTFGWYKNNLDGTFTYNPIFQSTVFENYDNAIGFGDFDNDNDIDIIGGKFDGIYLFTNDGNQNFTISTIDNSDTAKPTSWIKAVDINNDGNLDFITASDFNKFLLYINDGNGNFTRQIIDGQSANPNVNRYFINYVDLDQDGDIDLLGTWKSNTGHNNDKFVWYKNDGNQNFSIHIINDDFNSYSRNAHFIETSDIDNDGDIDIIGTNTLTGYVWFENNGNQNFTPRFVAVDNSSATMCFAVDIDNDGDFDIIGSRHSQIEWFQNDLITLSGSENTKNTFKIFPNPTTDFLNIESPFEQNFSIKLFDLQGKILLDEENASNKINLNQLNPGLYILKIKLNDETSTYKILKK